MCAAAGAGPMPIPQQELTTEALAQAIRYCLSDEAARAAVAIAQKIQTEDGIKAAATSFHLNLPIKQMSCDIIPHLPASFRFNKGKDSIKLSSLAAELLFANTSKDMKHLELYVLLLICPLYNNRLQNRTNNHIGTKVNRLL
jgi:hypothetical protein